MTAGPTLTAVDLTAPDRELPLLVVGPSLGTSAETLWSACAAELAGRFHVVGWDLPGHGRSAPADGPFSMDDLAEAVWTVVRRVLDDRGDPDGRLHYAGDSIGAAVGLWMLLSRPAWRFERATLACTGARIGTPEGWRERAAKVRTAGTSSLADGTPARWFAPGFAARRPEVAGALLAALEQADDDSYAWACDALAAFDVRHLLPRIDVPVLAVAGRHDAVTPVEGLAEIATGVARGRLVVLDDAAHLVPAETPEEVARLLTSPPPGAGRPDAAGAGLAGTGDGVAGMEIRRQVLGDTHVDRAIAGTTDVTRDFQDFITRYAWGGVWTRPGLDRRSRSLVTLTALVAFGQLEELALHVRAARRNGLSIAEISETLLHTAIYCGVPAANAAFRVAQRVLAETDPEGSADLS
ncbi:MAG: bifunctional 3-oxoadipate enol-lactonase/4-carboxymuconolactone decarboxylase PcaDC [Kineosporiaceae bacterium]